MLSNDDINFLKWISSRLVHKYNEEPKIILAVEDIINKISSETSYNEELQSMIHNYALSSIENLQQIADYINNQEKTVKENIRDKSIENHMSSFESLDFNNIIKL